MATLLLETNPDISLDILHQMAQMDGTVGVGQGTGDENLALAVGHRWL
jgi:hypothetical protein